MSKIKIKKCLYDDWFTEVVLTVFKILPFVFKFSLNWTHKCSKAYGIERLSGFWQNKCFGMRFQAFCPHLQR